MADTQHENDNLLSYGQRGGGIVMEILPQTFTVLKYMCCDLNRYRIIFRNAVILTLNT